MNENENAIECREATKRFGRLTAVDKINLKVAQGEFLTILGPNGAGKTTLLRMMAGLTRLSGGAISINGLAVNEGHDELRKRIGYISHQTFTYGQLTALENLIFFGRLYGIADPGARAGELLGEVGLAARAGDPARTYSRGMLQRLSIARALIHNPSILFLDEPFTGLDQHAAETLKRSLRRLHNENTTIVMITHNLKMGLDMGTRIALQVAGKIRLDEAAGALDRDGCEEVYFKGVGEAHY